MGRNHNKLKNEKNIFKIYKRLDERITSNQKLNERYEAELIEIIKNKFKKNSLKEVIEEIENTDPYSYGYVKRANFNRYINKILNLEKETKMTNNFCEVRNNKPINHLETMIQRNLFVSNKYNNIIGVPIFFEFPCNTYKPNTKKEFKGKTPIDLITYNDSEKTLYLVEFKKCCATKDKITVSDEKESKELFLRALFEITTYYSFFKHLIIDESIRSNIEKVLKKISGYDIELDEVKIKKVILGPKRLFNDIYISEVYDIKESNDVTCFSIELNENINSLKDYKINEKNVELFDIKEL